MKNTISWGNLPVKKKIEKIDFNHRIFQNKKNKLLTYGNGRSYGDVCQNNFLINLESLDKFIEIDQETNTLTCKNYKKKLDIGLDSSILVYKD